MPNWDIPAPTKATPRLSFLFFLIVPRPILKIGRLGGRLLACYHKLRVPNRRPGVRIPRERGRPARLMQFRDYPRRGRGVIHLTLISPAPAPHGGADHAREKQGPLTILGDGAAHQLDRGLRTVRQGGAIRLQ